MVEVRGIRGFEISLMAATGYVIVMRVAVRLQPVAVRMRRRIGVVVVDMGVVAARMVVEEQAGAWNGNRCEEDCQRARCQQRDAGSPPPHCVRRYHSS